MKTILQWALIGVGLVACGGEDVRAVEPGPASTAPASAAAATSAMVEAEPEETKSKADLLMGKNAEAPARLPIVRLLAPGFDQTVPTAMAPGYKIQYKVLNFNQMPEGAYVQLMLDGVPFRPITDLTETVRLSDLAGGKPLGAGEHILAIFVAAANHAAIKGANGVAVSRFWVGKKGEGQKGGSQKGGAEWNGASDPLLVMARPHGEYTGDAAQEILADFYLVNAELGDSAFSLAVTVTGPGIAGDGLKRTFTEWRPVMVWSASKGEHQLRAELLDPKGQPADVPWNPTVRTFTVR
jgi:hypothetical protein